MGKPPANQNRPGRPGQTKTMFFTEGNPAAALVTDAPSGMRQQKMRFETPEAALAWCRKNRANFYYMPVNVAGN